MEKTTATALVIEAIAAYKATHDIPTWQDDLVQIAEPGSEKWEEWQQGSSHMEGDPSTAEVALYVEGFGAYYGCVEAAIDDLGQYFADDEPTHEEA